MYTLVFCMFYFLSSDIPDVLKISRFSPQKQDLANKASKARKQSCVMNDARYISGASELLILFMACHSTTKKNVSASSITKTDVLKLQKAQ